MSVVAAVAVVVVGATTAFFSDTETSTGNTFTAGSLDLKVDSTAHYNGMICRLAVLGDDPTWSGYTWQPESGVNPGPDHYPQPGDDCEGTWTEKDLGVETDKFFNLTDVKPGDEGENTISLHVYDNDAWGRFVISSVEDLDNTCTEPETETGILDPECSALPPVLGAGELAESISFWAWLDQGSIPGFQCVDSDGRPVTECNDPTEGDNIQQCDLQGPTGNGPVCDEPTLITPGDVDAHGETHNIWEGLAAVYDAYCAGPNPPNPIGNPTGANEYGTCQGIAEDGRLVGSTTYYFGLAWEIPEDVGNEAQTDSLTADLSFEAVQHRNNPTRLGF